MNFYSSAELNFLKAVLTSITSPAPLDVVIIYRNDDFDSQPLCMLCAPQPIPRLYSSCWYEGDHFSLEYRVHFTALREMHSVRGFRLVFCLDVSDCIMWYALGEVKKVLRQEVGSGGFDYLLDEPVVTCERRVLCVGPRDPYVQRSMAVVPPVSAL